MPGARVGLRAICTKFLMGKNTRSIFEFVQYPTFWKGNPVNAKCQTLQRFKLCPRLMSESVWEKNENIASLRKRFVDVHKFEKPYWFVCFDCVCGKALDITWATFETIWTRNGKIKHDGVVHLLTQLFGIKREATKEITKRGDEMTKSKQLCTGRLEILGRDAAVTRIK